MSERNAIERLRGLHLDHVGGEYDPENCETCDDLAAVDALYQAAKWVTGTGYSTSPSDTAVLDDAYQALAAAVSRVEGTP